MPNICMIVQSNYPADPRVRRQAERLEREGYKVDVICMRKKSESKQKEYGSVTAYRVFNTYNQEKFLRYVFVSIMFFILAFLKLSLLSKKKVYDLIQIHNMPDFLVFVAIIQKLKQIPVILDVHDLTLELFADKWKSRKFQLLVPIIKFAEIISYRFADSLITVNDTCKDILIKKGVPPQKISVILNTANTSIFKFDQNRSFSVIEKDIKILYHGTVARRFGLHIAISSIAFLNKKIPNSILNIYGKYDSSYKEELISLIKTLKLEQNVFLHEFLALEEVYEIIKNSDIGIVPYLNSDYMNLSLSTKTFEYAASGLPIVATKLTSLSQIFNNESITFIEELNAENLAASIFELCLNAERRKKLCLNAYELLNKISGDVMGDRYSNLIKNTIYSD